MPAPAAPMDSAPPWALSANCGRSVWSHLGASKLTSSFSAGSGTRDGCLRKGRHCGRLRFHVAVGCARNDDSRNRMLEDELLLIAGFEDHRVLIERSDTSRQLHTADQIDRNIVPFLSCRVEEGILNVLLCRLGFHLPISFFLVRGRAVSIGKGNRRQLFSCRLLQYGLVKRFSTSRPIIFSGGVPLRLARPTAFPVHPKLVRPKKVDRVSFPSPPIYNRQFQKRVQNRSHDLDQHQPTYRLPDKPPDAVSLVAFFRRHNLARPAVFLQSGKCSLHEGT